MLIGYRNTMFGDSAYDYVQLLLTDGTNYKIKQPTFGSVLALKTNTTTWNPSITSVFPSTNASKLAKVVNNDSTITSIG